MKSTPSLRKTTRQMVSTVEEDADPGDDHEIQPVLVSTVHVSVSGTTALDVVGLVGLEALLDLLHCLRVV